MYLAIERARFEERLRVKIDVPFELRVLPIPPPLQQPLVENAVKHGISPARGGGEIVVAAELERVSESSAADTVILCIRAGAATTGRRRLFASRPLPEPAFG
ncbi:MAG: hypothetical protein L0387_17545 [Acidobacteria bacterium]|nr:hypothetical protein [Acidobacteriota bacterium]MCI0721323.1 hypothetical protein [Acidobacteriota bacterium]